MITITQLNPLENLKTLLQMNSLLYAFEGRSDGSLSPSTKLVLFENIYFAKRYIEYIPQRKSWIFFFGAPECCIFHYTGLV